MEIKYDTPFEVNNRQYKALMSQLPGIVAGQERDGKYYIKVWLVTYSHLVHQVLNLHK